MKTGIKLKVCGMRDKQNIIDVCCLKPDYLGFIFYEKSKRFVGEDFYSEIITSISSDILKVGVFVNADLNYIKEKIFKYKLDFVQLHGDETPNFCEEIKMLKVNIIKVFRLDQQFDFNVCQSYKNVCDYFLFDTQTFDFGGSGKRFDWNILKKYDNEIPFFLSGGIDLEYINDIFKIAEKMNIHAVDINSRFEISDGIKDVDKVKLFIENIKNNNFKKLIFMKFNVNENGYYGEYGGAFIPEMLYPNIEELRNNYLKIIGDSDFQKEYLSLLKDYVGRPTPLYYATRLSEHYKTNIYLKREDLSHTGSHKINNALGQILLAKRLKKTRIIAETGAGQHGVATATVCALMGLECIVYMGDTDVKRQAPNVSRMKMLGAKVVPVFSGNKTLKDATNEAIRDWINHPVDTHYIIGSVIGPHPFPDMVGKFQSVISEEMKKQLLEKTGRDYPDYILACVGGGSNAAGAFYHYLNNENVKLIAVEASGKGVDSGESAATTILGEKGIIHGCRTLLMQDDDGQIIEPYSISAGLDYPGIGPIHPYLLKTGRAKYLNATDDEALEAAYLLTSIEGIIPALESAHALAALKQIKFEKNDIVVVNVSGRGDKDLETYIKNMKHE